MMQDADAGGCFRGLPRSAGIRFEGEFTPWVSPISPRNLVVSTSRLLIDASGCRKIEHACMAFQCIGISMLYIILYINKLSCFNS